MKTIYLSFLIIIIPCILHSQWDNNSQLEGSGTEEDPYQITTYKLILIILWQTSGWNFFLS